MNIKPNIASYEEFIKHNHNDDYNAYVDLEMQIHEENQKEYQEWLLLLSPEERAEHEKTLATAVGKRLKQARKEFGVTQDKVAELLNVSKQTISNYETGTTYPPAKMIDRFATLYGVSIEYIKGTKIVENTAVYDEVISRLNYIKTIDYNNYHIQYSNPFEEVLSEEEWLRELINDGTKNLTLEQLRQLKDMILTWSLINVGQNF